MMKKNENKNKDKLYFLGLDTEDRQNHDPYLFALYGDICSRKGVVTHIDFVTENIQEIIDVLDRNVINTFLVGFNLAYDLNNLYPEYPREQKQWKGKFSGFKNTGKYKRDKIKGLEMMGKWFQGTGLKALAEKFGCEYIDEHRPDSPHIKAACRSHARAIQEITCKLEEKLNDLGYSMSFAKHYMPTAAATAFNIWKIMTGENPDNWDKSMNEIAGMSYHGGWCDLFWKCLIPDAFHYDVCSMYPSVMKNHDYPNPNIAFTKGKPEKIQEYLTTKAGFAVGIITVPDILISPFANRTEHKLLFTTGSWRVTITFPELEYLYELGGTFDCEEIYYTDRWQPFNDYVDKFYKLKNQKEYKEIGKLMLNSLSGKFGQKVRPEGEYQFIECTLDDLDKIPKASSGILTLFHVLGNVYEYKKPEATIAEYSYYPLISAYITAYSRIKLHKMMRLLGYENIIYCDTDSIVSTKSMLEEYITETKELGLWECEAQHVQFQGIAPKKYKEYRAGKWVYKANGIPHKKQEEYWKDPSKPVTWKIPLSFRQALRRHKKPNEWVEIKKISSFEDKRKFNDDGTSLPYSYSG